MTRFLAVLLYLLPTALFAAPFSIPAPYTAFNVSGDDVQVCVGCDEGDRTYEFSNSGLPSQITIDGVDMLSGPVAFGPSMGLTWLRSDITDMGQGQSKKITGVVTGNNLSGTTFTEIDFAGLVTFDATLVSEGAASHTFVLDIPVTDTEAVWCSLGPEYDKSLARQNKDALDLISGDCTGLSGNWRAAMKTTGVDRGIEVWTASSAQVCSGNAPGVGDLTAVTTHEIVDQVGSHVMRITFAFNCPFADQETFSIGS